MLNKEPLMCRGRNGYFRYYCFDVLGKYDPYYVSIYSKSRNVRTAPIQFVGDKEEIIELLESIIKKIKIS